MRRLALALVVACSPPADRTPAQTAADTARVTAYTAELQACLDKGKTAHSIETYRTCADGVDARFARQP